MPTVQVFKVAKMQSDLHFTLPEHLISPPVFSGVRVALSLVFSVMFCIQCLSCVYVRPNVVCSFWFTVSGCPFGIFELYLQLKCNLALKFQTYQFQMCLIFEMYFMTILPNKITEVVVQITANMTLIFLIILFPASSYQSLCLHLHLFHFLWADARLAEEVPESRPGLPLPWGADDLHPSPAQ